MIKVFISQPMVGKTDSEILEERDVATAVIKKWADENGMNPDEIFIIESFDKTTIAGETAAKNPRLLYLGRAIQYLADADYIYFVPGHRVAKGCLCEKFVAMMYGIKAINDNYGVKGE